MKKISSGVILMIFVILIAATLPASLWYASPWRSWRPDYRLKNSGLNKKAAPALVLNVSKVAGQHYGKLGQQEGLVGRQAASPNAATSSVAPVRGQDSGIGGGVGTINSKMIAGIMPPSEFKNYRFEYKGELAQGSSSVDVLRRLKTIDSSVNIDSLLASLNFGAANLASFNGMVMQSASFIQKGAYGYNINISLDDGSVSVGQNWETWPAGKCGVDQACYEAQQVKSLDEIPTDNEIIAIAEAFIKEHNINTSIYGDPEVSKYGIFSSDATSNKLAYPLETIDVSYPLKINDQYVYEEYGGQKQGLTVSIHLKVKRVVAVYGLTTQLYESSAYEVETDTKKILAYIEVGGMNNYRVEGAKTVILELGSPVRGYVKYYNYRNATSLKNLNDELLVPALVFPIKNIPKDNPGFYRTSVIVPLVKEVLDERLGSLTDGGVPTPFLMKGGASDDSATATEMKKK